MFIKPMKFGTSRLTAFYQSYNLRYNEESQQKGFGRIMHSCENMDHRCIVRLSQRLIGLFKDAKICF